MNGDRNTKYIIKYKDEGDTNIFEADDVQWKDYGVRAVNNTTGDIYVFPYYSIVYVKIEYEDE